MSEHTIQQIGEKTLDSLRLRSFYRRHKTSSIIFLLFLLIALPLTVFAVIQKSQTKSNANGTLSYDVVVIGAGTGGTSAAIQAARQGAHVALVEETDWLGGQMSTSGVSSMDEGYSRNGTIIERDSGIYQEFAQKIAAAYGGIANVHKCYWANDSLCLEPHAAHDILNTMIAQTGNINVFYRTKVVQVQKSGNTITGVLTHSTASGDDNILQAKVVIDATEYGDVIPLTGANYRIGKYIASNGINETTLNSCIQDITYPAIIKKYDGGIPAKLKITTEPPNYQAAKILFSNYLSKTVPANSRAGYPWSFTQMVGYRGVPETGKPSSLDASTFAGLQSITKTGVNIPANDIAETIRFIQDPAFRQTESCNAKLRTIQLLYYIQNELGQNWSVADDEGYNTAYNTTENNCTSIPAAFKEIEKRLPIQAYVRESRRIIGMTTLTSNQIQAQKDSDHQTAASVKPASFDSSIAIGGYNMDLHNCNTASTVDPSIDNINQVNSNHEKFQVPLESLIPETVDGFLAAEKNISQGRIANGATRLQPITMLTGQAAGALAALAAKTNRQPRTIPPIEVQNILLDGKAQISLYDLKDVPLTHPAWKGIQLISNYNIMVGYGNGTFGPDDVINRGTMAIVITRVLNIPTDNTPQDAYTKLKERGLTTAASYADFAPNDSLLNGQLALFIARTLGQSPADGPQAIAYLQSIGISVGCASSDPGACNTETATRGDMAIAVAGALTQIKTSTFTPLPTTIPVTVNPNPPTAVPTAQVATEGQGSQAQACPVEVRGFYDVASDDQPATKCFNERYCIVRGFSPHSLGPDDLLTREQYVAFILRYHDQIVGDWHMMTQQEVNALPKYPNKARNSETGNDQFLFTDVPADNVLAKEIYTSQKYGFIRGYQDGSFLPTEQWYFGFHGVNRNDEWPLGSPYVFTGIGPRVSRIDFLRGLYTYGKYHNSLPACNDLPNIQYP